MTDKISALQLVSGKSASDNICTVKRLLAALSPDKGQLVLLPENAISFATQVDYINLAETLGEGVYQSQLASLAKRYACYLVCGSFPIKSSVNDKIHTTSLVYSPDGTLISHYHKIHLFDALVSDQQGQYKESATFLAGEALQVFDWKTDSGTYRVGLAICYDLRFPAMFQALRAQGADILLLPAAFTQVTGAAHWLPLLQARAIENQCYVLAANQGGLHSRGRETYGHSMVISPWGEVLDKLQYNEGFVCAAFSKATLDEIRASMPVLAHNRFTSVLK